MRGDAVGGGCDAADQAPDGGLVQAVSGGGGEQRSVGAAVQVSVEVAADAGGR